MCHALECLTKMVLLTATEAMAFGQQLVLGDVFRVTEILLFR